MRPSARSTGRPQAFGAYPASCSCRSRPPRRTTTSQPRWRSRSAPSSWPPSRIRSRPTCTTTSPGRKPSLAAVEPRRTTGERRPPASSTPRSSATPGTNVGHAWRRRRDARPPDRARRPGRPAARRAAPPPRSLRRPLRTTSMLRAVADAARGQPVEHGARVVHLVPVHGDDHVAGLQARLGRGALVVEAHDQRAGDPAELELLGQLARHGVELGAEPRPLQLASRRRRCRPPA